MGLVSGRVIILLLIIFVGFGWGLATGLVGLSHDDYKCYQNKWWYAVGDKQRVWSIGRVTLYYQPMNFDCQPDFRYDPKVYSVQDGLLVPIAH